MSDEQGRHFVDTNVFVYAYDHKADEKHQRAQDILRDLWANRNGCVCIQILQEFYVTVTRKIPNPLTSDATAQIISDLATWTVHSPTSTDVLNAIEIQQRHQLSFWDAMVINSAIQLGCDILWSEDLNDGQFYDGVRVSNPFN